MKPYSKKSNARRAALQHLGAGAREGVDFTIEPSGQGFRWTPIATGGRSAAPADAGPVPDFMRRDQADARGKDPVLAHVESELAKPAAQKPSKRPSKAKGARRSKTEEMLAAMRSKDGLTSYEAADRFGWQERTARARMSVAVRDRRLFVAKTKEDGRQGTVYRIKEGA